MKDENMCHWSLEITDNGLSAWPLIPYASSLVAFSLLLCPVF